MLEDWVSFEGQLLDFLSQEGNSLMSFEELPGRRVDSLLELGYLLDLLVKDAELVIGDCCGFGEVFGLALEGFQVFGEDGVGLGQ